MERPRVGVGVIVERDGRMLLMRRRGSHGAGTWCNPGGHLEGGETLEGCARRETMEEVGVEIGDVTFVAVPNDVFAESEQPHRHYVTLWVRGAYVAGEPTVASAREMTEVGWFAPGALPSPLFLPLANLLAGRCYPPR